MNLLVVGASYRTAPVSTLERLAVAATDLPDVLARLVAQPYVNEAVVVSTCNRVEVYAAVSGFHGGLGDVCAILAQHAGIAPNSLAGNLYVHYERAAVEHVFRVAAGLDSMVVGEAQILGQLRDAYHGAGEADTAGRLLHELMQQALRVGKRAHAETGIDSAGRSVVTAALDLAAAQLGDDLAGRPALVIGAGAMGALSVATLARRGAGPLAVTNRSPQRAVRLAESYGAEAVAVERLTEVLSTVDIVVAATASTEAVLTREVVSAALAVRGPARGRLVLLDLAVPRDIEPEVAQLPGVEVIDIERLGEAIADSSVTADAAAVAGIVDGEVDSFLAWMRGADVGPTVAALRSRADDVVTTELRRLAQRRSEFTDDQRADIARTVHRIVQRLLHQPTVRVRQLAAEPGGDQYAALLRELFDLDVQQSAPVDGVPDLSAVPPATGAAR
ncbi:glutamyl-tRNA reductase [Micromonosporaceae bacterium DT55]|uniref:glutamyl-tRNA reductase n=1 Tax=Melissospora conviva TaxID=3388432 RepID=UPI003C15530A